MIPSFKAPVSLEVEFSTVTNGRFLIGNVLALMGLTLVLADTKSISERVKYYEEKLQTISSPISISCDARHFGPRPMPCVVISTFACFVVLDLLIIDHAGVS